MIAGLRAGCHPDSLGPPRVAELLSCEIAALELTGKPPEARAFVREPPNTYASPGNARTPSL